MVSLQKLRSHRIFGIALFDLSLAVLGMIIGMIVLHNIHFKNLKISNFIIAAILLTIPVGIFTHIIFGVNTTLNYRLGLSNKPS